MHQRFFGQHLLSRGLISASDLLAAVAYQNTANARLGERAVAMGIVTTADAERINALQTQEDLLFGEAAVRLGLMDRAQVEQVLSAQRQAHVHLGQALVELGHLAAADLEPALQEFERAEAANRPTLVFPDSWHGAPLAERLSELAPRLLLRTWGLQSKLDAPRTDADPLLLSDLNARVALAADPEALLLVGVPYAAAHKVATQDGGDKQPQDADLKARVETFAATLARQLSSVMAERGVRITPGASRTCSASVAVPETAMGVSMPLLTHVGQVIVGLIG